MPLRRGAFLLGHTEGGTAVSTKFQSDFDQSLESISSFGRGSTPSSHVVRAGESLSSIAASLWGDSSLWYKLAEANGLSGAAMLGEGQTLRIPAGVMSSAHNASSFTPYDPSEAVANISPAAPKPPKKKGCGGFGQILLVVIAVVVTIYTAGAAAGAMGALANGAGFGGVLTGAMAGGSAALGGAGLSAAFVAGTGLGSVGAAGAGLALGASSAFAAGAIGGAVGSMVSQGVGVMTGIQEKFSWNAVALAAIGGGVGASGFGNAVAKSVGAAKGLANAAVSGAANNALTQGIGVALGAQKEFSWAGVAAAGVGGAAFQLAGKLLPGAARFDVVKGQKVPIAASWSNKLGASMASTIADAGARSLIEGSDFGDNVMAALPNVIGQTIGSVIAGGIARSDRRFAVSAKPLEELAPAKFAPLLPIPDAPQLRLASASGARRAESERAELTLLETDEGRRLVDAWERERDRPTLRAPLGFLARAGQASPFLGPGVAALATGYVAIKRGGGLLDHYQTDRSLTPILNIPYDSALGPLSPGASPNPLGFGVSVQSREEAVLLAEMQLQGASATEINGALDRLRGRSGAPARTPTTDELRSWPGVAYVSGDPLPVINGPWLFGGEGLIPGQVADRLAGRRFESIHQFRSEVWRTVADIPELAAQFDAGNRSLMRDGNAPFAIPSEQHGGQGVFQIHHPHELRFGGSLYDMSNMRVVTPRRHNEIHYGRNGQ